MPAAPRRCCATTRDSRLSATATRPGCWRRAPSGRATAASSSWVIADPGVAPEHRISPQSRARLRTALRIARAAPLRAVILTGYTSAGGLSEAEQMKGAWDESEAPALLEVAGRNTAENASRSLPLVLAMGDVRRVTVVTSAWHIRAPWFFAPYRRFDLDVGYHVSFARGGWAPLLAREFREARRARAERRQAMAAMREPPWDAVS